MKPIKAKAVRSEADVYELRKMLYDLGIDLNFEAVSMLKNPLTRDELRFNIIKYLREEIKYPAAIEDKSLHITLDMGAFGKTKADISGEDQSVILQLPPPSSDLIPDPVQGNQKTGR